MLRSFEVSGLEPDRIRQGKIKDVLGLSHEAPL